MEFDEGFYSIVEEAALARTDVPLADLMTERRTQYGNLRWMIEPLERLAIYLQFEEFIRL